MFMPQDLIASALLAGLLLWEGRWWLGSAPYGGWREGAGWVLCAAGYVLLGLTLLRLVTTA